MHLSQTPCRHQCASHHQRLRRFLLRLWGCWRWWYRNLSPLVQATEEKKRYKIYNSPFTFLDPLLIFLSTWSSQIIFTNLSLIGNSDLQFPIRRLTLKTLPRFCVKREEERPWWTSLFHWIPASKEGHLRAYTIGAKVSRWTTGESCESPVMMVGSTKKPSRSITLPPNSIFPVEKNFIC